GERGKYWLAEESQAAKVKVPPQVPVKFVDATKASGISGRWMKTENPGQGLEPGACFLDYDGDGLLDLFLPDNGNGMALYHNVDNGKFQDVTEQAGLDPKSDAVSCTAGVYDNDGVMALLVGAAIHRVVI